MRHYRKGRKLGTDASHTKAMKKSLAVALFTNDRIKTTVPRAKEMRPLVEKIISWAKKGDLHSRRLAIAALGDKELVREVFAKAEQGMWADRDGGYTRIIKLGPRKGDNAPMCIIEIVAEPVGGKPAPVEKKSSGKKDAGSEKPAAEEEPAAEEAAAEEEPAAEEAAESEEAAAEEAAESEEPAESEEAAAEEAADSEEPAAEEAAESEEPAESEEAAAEEAADSEEPAAEEAAESEDAAEEAAAEEEPAAEEDSKEE